MIRKCAYCHKKLKRKPSRIKMFMNSYCNHKHRGLFFRGKPTWNKGLKGVYILSEEHKKIKSEDYRKKIDDIQLQFKQNGESVYQER